MGIRFSPTTEAPFSSDAPDEQPTPPGPPRRSSASTVSSLPEQFEGLAPPPLNLRRKTTRADDANSALPAENRFEPSVTKPPMPALSRPKQNSVSRLFHRRNSSGTAPTQDRAGRNPSSETDAASQGTPKTPRSSTSSLLSRLTPSTSSASSLLHKLTPSTSSARSLLRTLKPSASWHRLSQPFRGDPHVTDQAPTSRHGWTPKERQNLTVEQHMHLIRLGVEYKDPESRAEMTPIDKVTYLVHLLRDGSFNEEEAAAARVEIADALKRLELTPEEVDTLRELYGLPVSELSVPNPSMPESIERLKSSARRLLHISGNRGIARAQDNAEVRRNLRRLSKEQEHEFIRLGEAYVSEASRATMAPVDKVTFLVRALRHGRPTEARAASALGEIAEALAHMEPTDSNREALRALRRDLIRCTRDLSDPEARANRTDALARMDALTSNARPFF